jgi:D-beta-D-heptose 7-phosphate kinase/D-beta-D-heptose 1-phosphate adenosyltransferase
MKNLKLEEFKNLNILVIGDSGEDIFQYGSITRLCPEAPVPVFNPTNRKSNPGMSGNVVANLKALGANVIHITNSTCITKTRLVDERTNQILLRVDENDRVENISFREISKIKNNKYNNIKIDAIIISDYDKGFLNENNIEFICSNNTNVFIDTKKIIDTWAIKASFLKINHVEYEKTKYTLKNLNIKDKLIITLSDKGCIYKDQIFSVEKVKIKDVSGAGDTFISGLVLEWLRTREISLAIKFAQECATVVVQKQGVVTI